jgi:hypothetical protein
LTFAICRAIVTVCNGSKPERPRYGGSSRARRRADHWPGRGRHDRHGRLHVGRPKRKGRPEAMASPMPTRPRRARAERHWNPSHASLGNDKAGMLPDRRHHRCVYPHLVDDVRWAAARGQSSLVGRMPPTGWRKCVRQGSWARSTGVARSSVYRARLTTVRPRGAVAPPEIQTVAIDYHRRCRPGVGGDGRFIQDEHDGRCAEAGQST